MKVSLCVLFFFFAYISNAQFAFNAALDEVSPSLASGYFKYTSQSLYRRKLFQHNSGMIFGVQRGSTTSIELGAEEHWRKLSLLKPHVIGATANLEYDVSNHVIGYKAGMWMKRGRVNLTYGANVSYYNNFKKGSRFGFGPSVGFRLMGFHLINGYNFLTKDKGVEKESATPV